MKAHHCLGLFTLAGFGSLLIDCVYTTMMVIAVEQSYTGVFAIGLVPPSI